MTDADIQRSRAIGMTSLVNSGGKPTEVETWMSDLGTKFVDVWFLVNGSFIDERHVDDPVTIQTTVKMSAERLRAKCAVYAIDGEWELARYPSLTFRRFPSKEAAEMAGIISG